MRAEECVFEINLEMNTYYFAIGSSLAFTVFAMFMYFCCLKARLDGAPFLASQFFFLLGCIKLIFGAFIWVGLQPHCPEGCTCAEQDPLPIYPIFALVLGLRWILEGYQKLQMSRAISGEGEDKDGPIFDAVSTVEMV
jgi:hypothetical protein